MAVTRPAALTVLAAALFSAAPAWAQKPIPETVRMMEPHHLRIGDYVRAWPTVPGPIVQGPVVDRRHWGYDRCVDRFSHSQAAYRLTRRPNS